jgi:hypothetical protein
MMHGQQNIKFTGSTRTYVAPRRLVNFCRYSTVRRFVIRFSGYHKAGKKRDSHYVASPLSPGGQKRSRAGSNITTKAWSVQD